MIVVSNTSPIINLAAIEQLDLLQRLYGKITIPKAVYREIVIDGAGEPGAMAVQTLEWIETKQVKNPMLAHALQTELHEGEAEAIALAVELKADLLLLDERRGRKVASNLRTQFIGLLGVIIEARHKAYILAVKPVLDDLVTKAGFWVSQQLYTRVLQVAGE